MEMGENVWIVGGLGDKKNGFLEPHFSFSLDFDVNEEWLFCV